MAKRLFTDLASALEGWDAIINDNLALLRDFPLPIKSYSSPANLPTAGQNNESIALTVTPAMLWSTNGTAWRPLEHYVDTTERLAGYDEINNKPIYAKTLQFTLANAGPATQPHGVSGLDVAKGNYLRVDATVSDGTTHRVLPWYDGTDRLEVTVNATNVVITSTKDETGSDATVTLYYTK